CEGGADASIGADEDRLKRLPLIVLRLDRPQRWRFGWRRCSRGRRVCRLGGMACDQSDRRAGKKAGNSCTHHISPQTDRMKIAWLMTGRVDPRQWRQRPRSAMRRDHPETPDARSPDETPPICAAPAAAY